MKWSKLVLPALIPFALVGCLDSGSSDGDDGGTTSFDPITYTGETTQATFNNTDFSTIEPFLEVVPGLREVEEVLSNVEDVVWDALNVQTLSGNETLTGSCGGTLSVVFTSTYNNETDEGTYDATFSADNYCDTNIADTKVEMNGSMVVDADYSEATDNEYVRRNSYAFDEFSIKGDDTNMGLDGTIDYSYLSSTRTSTVDLVIEERTEGIEGKFTAFTVVALVEDDGSPLPAKSVEGRIDLSGLGYAQLETLENMISFDADGYPTSGKIRLTGTNAVDVTFTAGEPVIE